MDLNHFLDNILCILSYYTSILPWQRNIFLAAFWDTRKGSQPIEVSAISNSHSDPLYKCIFLTSKTGRCNSSRKYYQLYFSNLLSTFGLFGMLLSFTHADLNCSRIHWSMTQSRTSDAVPHTYTLDFWILYLQINFWWRCLLTMRSLRYH